FFFQAEDGIRDPLVTGVQTCALPISLNRSDYQLIVLVHHNRGRFIECMRNDGVLFNNCPGVDQPIAVGDQLYGPISLTLDPDWDRVSSRYKDVSNLGISGQRKR